MKIYNSLKRAKEEFVPLHERRVSMYVCGPTVYDEPHIGHARSAYVFDVIRRYLEYRQFAVTFVRNVTDVDDKIIDKARKEYKGEDLNSATLKVAEKYLDSYHDYMDLLGIKKPDHEPRAMAYIQKMQVFIRDLIDRGAAYASGGDVYFDIQKAKGYGKLSNQNLDKMESGVRISPGEKKRNPLDFALWKSAKEGEPAWDSPWGKGRPGWHIECSVMSSDILGDEFDIHGGGIDLVFPHHENEVAQSEGAGKKFARYWIHNGLLTINHEKMAKSLGNFITMKDFIGRHKDLDYLKLLFLSTHYRHPVDYTEEKVEEMKRAYERIDILIHKLAERFGAAQDVISSGSASGELGVFRDRFIECMDDDFNAPRALSVLFDLVSQCNAMLTANDKGAVSAFGLIGEMAGVFGLSFMKRSAADISDGEIAAKISLRSTCKKERRYKDADDIRKGLEGLGIILEDKKDGTTTWRRKL